MRCTVKSTLLGNNFKFFMSSQSVRRTQIFNFVNLKRGSLEHPGARDNSPFMTAIGQRWDLERFEIVIVVVVVLSWIVFDYLNPRIVKKLPFLGNIK